MCVYHKVDTIKLRVEHPISHSLWSNAFRATVLPVWKTSFPDKPESFHSAGGNGNCPVREVIKTMFMWTQITKTQTYWAQVVWIWSKMALPLSNCPVLSSFHFHYVVELFEHLFRFYGNLWNELSSWRTDFSVYFKTWLWYEVRPFVRKAAIK